MFKRLICLIFGHDGIDYLEKPFMLVEETCEHTGLLFNLMPIEARRFTQKMEIKLCKRCKSVYWEPYHD